MGERGSDDGAANVTGGSEDLGIVRAISIDLGAVTLLEELRLTTHTRCSGGFAAPAGSQLEGSCSLDWRSDCEDDDWGVASSMQTWESLQASFPDEVRACDEGEIFNPGTT